MIYTVRVSSLKCLKYTMDVFPRFVIDAPSLESLDIDYSLGGIYLDENRMTKIAEAHVSAKGHTQHLLRSISSVKRLCLCTSSKKEAYPVGITFDCLERLTLCTCGREWLDLLMRVLRDSPKLRALKLVHDHLYRTHEPR